MDVGVIEQGSTPFKLIASTRQGKLFQKELLRKGKFSHPGKPGEMFDVTDDVLDKMVQNFNDGVCDIVQVPVVDDLNKHTEAPDRNAGVVVGLERQGDSLVATLDIRKPEIAEQLGKTILGGSAMFALDYKDTRTDKQVGPTLLHSALTNRPHVVGLEPFRELVSAASDQSLDDVVVLTAVQEEPKMQTLDELKKLLKDEHKIDLDALQAAAANQPDPDKAKNELVAALTGALSQAGLIKLSAGDTPKPEELVTVVTTLAASNTALQKDVDTLKLAATTAEVDGLIAAGRVLPTQKDAMIKLASENRPLFDQIVPQTSVVKLSNEEGVTTSVEATEKDTQEIERYVAAANGKAK